MADRNSRFSVKKKEKKVENKTNDDKDKDKEKGKEKLVKKPEKLTKKTEKIPEQPKADEEARNGESDGAKGAEASNNEENGEFEPFELPPFEIVKGFVRLYTYTTKKLACLTSHTCFALPLIHCLIMCIFFFFGLKLFLLVLYACSILDFSE